MLKLRGKWAQRPYRRRFVYQVMSTAHAIAVHVRPWVEERFSEAPHDADALLDALTTEAGAA